MPTTHPMTRKDEEKMTRNLRGRAVATPPVDIYENEREYLLHADLPGVKSEQLQIRLDNGELTLEATWSVDEVKDASPVVREYVPTDYRRTFILPDSVDANAVTAELKNGLLTIHLPKSEASRPRTIQITGA